MTRSPRLARDAPLRRSQVEETMSITLPAKRAVIEEVTPSPPPLPLIELVIVFIINGKETGECSLEVDVNQEFQSFQLQLARFIKPKLPRHLFIYSDGVDVSYKRAYVTKAQEAKRKELTWKDFADEMDYSGLLNAIRNSKA